MNTSSIDTFLDTRYNLVVKTRTGQRIIPKGAWYINRNTELGEDADIYERKPYDGRKWIPRSSIIGVQKV